MKTMLRLIWVTAFALSFVSGMAASCLPVEIDEFGVLMGKIRIDFADNPSIDEALAKYDNANGSFTDIDYTRTDRTNWEPLIHIDRVSDFVFAYTNPQNEYYQDKGLYNKIVAALEYWYQRNPNCSNWWYNQIAEPQKIGVLLIQMRVGKQQIPSDLENRILQRMKVEGGDPAEWTGANMTDIALHWIYRACLTSNEDMLRIAIGYSYSTVKYTTVEGFQYDNSYFQHGAQLYIGGYGDEILKGVMQVAMYTQGTQYALPPDKLAILSKFMRETYYQTIRGKYMLFDVLGRGISRPSITDKRTVALFAKRMIVLEPEHANEYRTIVERLEGKKPADYGVKPFHTHYFKGDYTLHVRSGYTFDVRMVSKRTSRCEYGNGENLKTYFLSDGCNNIVINGDEYFNIFPVWDWAKIPGVTAPQMDTIPKAVHDWQIPGTATFAGGVSDSVYGVTTYSYEDIYAGINTAAKKAWFFFDDEIVCLGAGITSTATVNVNTTINQCLLRGDQVVVSMNNRVATVGMGDFSYENNLGWVLHNGVGYVFPAGGHIFLTNRVQTGDWYDINTSAPRGKQEQAVFTLGFEHGLSPQNATYAYIVVPNKNTVKDMDAYPVDNIEILANTDSVQVVRNKNLGVWQMVFYRGATFHHDQISVRVDKGCALLFKDIEKADAQFYIADPAQTQSMINVDICATSVSKKNKRVICDFTGTGIYAGMSEVYSFK
ncbi:polysaccharide lyase 8 family protein [Bacteroides sp.]